MTMYRSAAVLLALLCLGAHSRAQCVQAGGMYEGFRVSEVRVETPLEFPVHWIERVLLGRAIDSLQSITDALPVKKDAIFHFSDHVAAMVSLSREYSDLSVPRERLRIALVLPKFTNCNLTNRTVDVVYRVYSTEAHYFSSRLLESQPPLPDRSLTIGAASQENNELRLKPFADYNTSRKAFGGVKASFTGDKGLLNSLELEAGGSPSSYLGQLALGGTRDLNRGVFSHLEWKIGFHSSQDPAGSLVLLKSVATVHFLGATRAYGRFGTMLRFGATVEGGRLESTARVPGVLTDGPQRVLKAFLGTTSSYKRQTWNASYAFQVGKGTDQVPVDYTKHLVDLSHQIRFLPREHFPIQLDTHLNAGWIAGLNAEIPVTQRFFAGNLPEDFVGNPLWQIPAGPLLRSFPENTLNVVGSGLPIGGTSFAALNVTAAFPVRAYPAIPAMIRYAKPLQDGIHLGLKEAERASLEDFRAQNRLFSEAMDQAVALTPDLEALKECLSSLAAQELPVDLIDDLNDLVSNYIDPTIKDIENAKKIPNGGLAWSVCHRLSMEDPDIYPIAHLHDEIANSVAPELEAANHSADAKDLRAIAEKLEIARRNLASLLDRIEPSAVVAPASLNTFNDDLTSLKEIGERLAHEAEPFVGAGAPVGSLASATKEWANSLVIVSDFGPNPDPFDSLYALNRLSVGIGKLVPPLLVSVAVSSDQLAEAIKEDHHAESELFKKIAQDLRAKEASLSQQVRKLSVPPGERWARQQNDYFVRALDVTFREMNLAAVSPVLAFDSVRLGPSRSGFPAVRYGIGPGIRFSIVSFQVTAGYSFNPDPQPSEKFGAFFFSMNVIDLFR